MRRAKWSNVAASFLPTFGFFHTKTLAISSRRQHKHRLLAPEVVQTSAMDCGPAALKSVLEGHGIHVSYARLRDACQTDVDGTSIDTMEELANQLGLAAEQVLVPADHLLLPEAHLLPVIAVVTLAGTPTATSPVSEAALLRTETADWAWKHGPG